MTISVSEAAARIRAGELAAFPTETVYGLGANALNEAAVRKIYQLKGRPETSPLIVHVATAEMARQVVAEWPPLAQELADRWWPGPLTLVLPKNTCVPDLVTAGLGTVGVRVPRHPVALELIEKAGVPIAAPSANRFMGLSPTSAAHVTAAFGDQVPVVDGGPVKLELNPRLWLSKAASSPCFVRGWLPSPTSNKPPSRMRRTLHRECMNGITARKRPCC